MVEAVSAGEEVVVATIVVVAAEEATMTTVVVGMIVVVTHVVEDMETAVAGVDTAVVIVMEAGIPTRIAVGVTATNPGDMTPLLPLLAMVVVIVMIVVEIDLVAVETTVSLVCTMTEEDHEALLYHPDTWLEMNPARQEEAISLQDDVITPRSESHAALIMSRPLHPEEEDQ